MSHDFITWSNYENLTVNLLFAILAISYLWYLGIRKQLDMILPFNH